jgi:hypothetical protein
LLGRDYLERIVLDKGDHDGWFYECTRIKLPDKDEEINKVENIPYIRIPLHYQIFVHRDTLRRVLQLKLKTVIVVPVLNPDGTHKSFTRTVSWQNSYGPKESWNYISANHCQKNSSINLYDLVAIHRYEQQYKMNPVGGLAGFGKRRKQSRRKQIRRKRQTPRK